MFPAPSPAKQLTPSSSLSGVSPAPSPVRQGGNGTDIPVAPSALPGALAPSTYGGGPGSNISIAGGNSISDAPSALPNDDEVVVGTQSNGLEAGDFVAIIGVSILLIALLYLVKRSFSSRGQYRFKPLGRKTSSHGGAGILLFQYNLLLRWHTNQLRWHTNQLMMKKVIYLFKN